MKNNDGNGNNRLADAPNIDPRKVPDPLYSESVKVLRAKLETLLESRRIKVVAVTSAVSGEGKTLLAGALASSIAASGNKKVLLVDTDLRKGDLSRIFQVKLVPGLAEYAIGVTGIKTIFRSSGENGLYLVPAGKFSGDSASYLGGEAFRNFLGLVSREFDTVILDTPPVLPVADSIALCGHDVGFLLVVRAGYTPLSAVKQAVENIGDNNILGVVLNGVEQKTQRYYQKYYGKYYRATSTETP